MHEEFVQDRGRQSRLRWRGDCNVTKVMQDFLLILVALTNNKPQMSGYTNRRQMLEMITDENDM